MNRKRKAELSSPPSPEMFATALPSVASDEQQQGSGSNASHRRRKLKKTAAKKKRAAEDAEWKLKEEALKAKIAEKSGNARKVAIGEHSRVPFVRRIEPSKKRLARRNSSDSGDGCTFSIANPTSFESLVSKSDDIGDAAAAGHDPGDSAPDHRRYLPSLRVCALCQMHANVARLGDLFGEYSISLDPAKRLHETCPIVPSSSKKLTSANKKAALEGKAVQARDSAYFTKFWLHGDCAVWTPGIYLRAGAGGPTLVGCDGTLPDCWAHTCSICKLPGASLRCAQKGCKRVYHFPCSRDSNDCEMMESKLSVRCRSHDSQMAK